MNIDGRFRITGVIGEGGMGVVYDAVQLAVQRPVAIKMIRAGLDGDDAHVRRLVREVRLLAQLDHPNIVTIIDAGETEAGGYIVMERLVGRSLDAALADGPLGWRRACAIALQLCNALVASHAHGIVHRDLKPANIMLVDEPALGELVKVLDFGIAKSVTSAARSSEITMAGAIVGTPQYMAPEAIDGGLDPRIDLYALGCILHEMIAGTPPFSGDDLRAVLVQQMHGEPPPLPPDTPRAVAELVRTLLAKSPELRPASAEAVRQSLAAITAWEDDERPTIERPQRAPSPYGATALIELPQPQPWHGILIAICVLLALAGGAFLITLRCL